MRTWISLSMATAAAFAVASPIVAEPGVGTPVPNFRAYDMHGKIVDLVKYRGKTVILEWNNPGCPFVQRHYESGNMQKTQSAAVAQGAVWLTINSGAPGKQGHMSGPEAQKFVSTAGAKPSAYLLDPQGLVGKGYGAKTTPHMYVIDAKGRLTYSGAIDDNPRAEKAEIPKARNHVLAAIGEMRAGKPVSVAQTRPYGCSVKYPD